MEGGERAGSRRGGHDGDREGGWVFSPDPAGVKAQREAALEAFVERVAAELAGVDPRRIAACSGAAYDPEARELAVPVFGRRFAVAYPSLRVPERDAGHQASTLWFQVLLAHYFRTADGTPPAGRWVSLRELPGGLLYERAFQGYSGNKLARGFGPDFARLTDAAATLSAQPLDIGDLSFCVDLLPRVPIAVVCYQGDEEQRATAQLLFDAAAPHYLPTDALATSGGRLTRLLLDAGGVVER